MRKESIDSPPCVRLPTGRETMSEEEIDEMISEEDLFRVPRSGRRKLMPIEKLR